MASVKKIPRGKVMTYAGLARAVGRPRAARAVGNILAKNRDIPHIPCHRVVRSDGRLGGYRLGFKRKRKFLSAESVQIKEGRVVDFKEKLYTP